MSPFDTWRAVLPPDRIQVHLLDQARPPLTKDGRVIVVGKADSSAMRKRGGRRLTPDLQLEPDMFGDACVSGLVEDWIVPMVVERIIQDILKPPSNTEE